MGVAYKYEKLGKEEWGSEIWMVKRSQRAKTLEGKLKKDTIMLMGGIIEREKMINKHDFNCCLLRCLWLHSYLESLVTFP
jgi:hypothetical protein